MTHDGEIVRALSASIGHAQELGCALLGRLAVAIVAAGGLDLGMAGQLLDGTEVGRGIEQIADEGAAEYAVLAKEQPADDLGRLRAGEQIALPTFNYQQTQLRLPRAVANIARCLAIAGVTRGC
jgi:hypothetical protein